MPSHPSRQSMPPMQHSIGEAWAGVEPLPYVYEPWLLAPAWLLAIAGAWAALQIAGNLSALSRGRRRWLLAAGSLAVGTGTWGMHFLAMLAFELPLPVTYDTLGTLASIVPILVASAVFLWLVAQARTGIGVSLMAGACAGIGIAAMHYAGMAAMHAEVRMVAEPGPVVASIAIAIAISAAAHHAAVSPRGVLVRRIPGRPAAAVLLGTAVAAMHLAGMAAVSFLPAESVTTGAVAAIDPRRLGGFVAVGVVLVIIAILGVAALDLRIRLLNASVRGSWHHLSAAIKGIPEGFLLFDDQSRLVAWNDRIERMSPELGQILQRGKPYDALFPGGAAVPPSARPANAAEADANGSDAGAGELEVDTRDGRRFRITETAVDHGHRVVAWRDVTENERGRRQLQAFFDQAPCAFVIIDSEGTIVQANQLALELLRYSADEIVGQRCSMLVPKERASEFRLRIECCLQGDFGASEPDANSIGLRRDGSSFPAEIRPNLIEIGGEPMVVLSVTDLSERRRIADQLDRSQRMELVGQLSGGLAHDFNNLLTVVIANLQLLEAAVISDDAALERVRDALEAAGRGSELTRRMLAFARRQLLAPQILNVNARIADLVPLIGKTITASVRIETRLDPDLWNVEIDPSQLESALLNLALNARDAIASDGRLTITTGNTRLEAVDVERVTEFEPGDYIRITVADNGAGMKRDVLERVFEPFFTTKAPGHGSGLGLSMVYGFVRQSLGVIDIDSRPGVGTRVNIYLPRSRRAVEEATALTSQFRTVAGGNEHILLVDDDDQVRRAAARLLGNLGYEVVEVSNGREALNELADTDGEFDLLFTDIVMPGGLSGLQLAEMARARYPALRVLLTSGYTDTTVLAGGVLSSREPFLGKPYRRQELAEKVRAALDHPLAEPPPPQPSGASQAPAAGAGYT